MHWRLRIGRVGGTPVELHWSAAVGVVLLGLLLASSLLPALVPGQQPVGYVVAGTAAALGLLGSLLAHELAHTVVARRHGLPVRRVTLWLLGGLSELGAPPRTPSEEIRVSGAGPATSLLLGVLCGVAAAAVANVPLAAAALGWVALMNLLIGVLNLLPGTPLDGGRIAHGVIWGVSGDAERATRVAAGAGRLIGALLVATGAVLLLRGMWDGLWLALIGWVLAGSAGAELARATATERLGGLTLAGVMSRTPVTLPGWLTVAAALATLAEPDAARHRRYPVVDIEGGYQGVVTLRDLLAVPDDRRDEVRIRDAARDTGVVVAEDDEPLVDVVGRLPAPGGIAVVLHAGRPVGLLTPCDIDRALAFAAPADHPSPTRGARP